MELYEIDAQEYGKLVDGLDIPIYSKSSFLELNKAKVDNIHYLLGKDTRNRLALAIGEKKGEWLAPFSAPFSNLVELRRDTTVEKLYDFFSLLVNYVKDHAGKSINLYMPANIYGEHFNAKIMNTLIENGFNIKFVDINYSFELNNIDIDKYESMIHSNARKNLRIAEKSELGIQRCIDSEEVEKAYFNGILLNIDENIFESNI